MCGALAFITGDACCAKASVKPQPQSSELTDAKVVGVETIPIQT